jgi:hypothetical protein
MKPKPQSDEYKAFEALLGSVLQMSKVELQGRMEAEKATKAEAKRS